MSDKRVTLAEYKTEMNAALLDSLRECSDGIKVAKNGQEEMGDLVAYSLIWRAQIEMYFDFAFYEGITLMGMTPQRIEAYFASGGSDVDRLASVVVNSARPFYETRTKMLTAYYSSIDNLYKACKHVPQYWLDNLKLHTAIKFDRIIDQYLRITMALGLSKEKLDKIIDSNKKPPLRDFKVNVVNNQEAEYTLVTLPEAFTFKKDDDIVRISSSEAIAPDTNSNTESDDDEDEWS